MEIHKYTDIIGRTINLDIYEGRMACLTAAGAKLPTSAGESALAKYVVAWPVDNREMPIYKTYPSYSWALRYGFDRTRNTPFSATVMLTYPGLESTPQEIPSGTGALLYDKGEFTVTSGNWVYSTAIVGGVELEVVNTAGADRGKLTILDGGTAVAIATNVDTSENLRFRSYGG